MPSPGTSKSAATPMDMISSLPDDILCNILSFLTIEEAVATSILSKRWIHLWHSVPNIHFKIYVKIGTIESNSNFSHFVDSILVKRESTFPHPINSFYLVIEYTNKDNNIAYKFSMPKIVEWINFIVLRKLKHLVLHLYSPYDQFDDNNDNPPELPINILNCKTLVSLDLYWFTVEGFSFSSIGFGLPSLKKLELIRINFTKVRDLLLLLVGCPILENLLVANIFFKYEEDSNTIQEFKNLSLPKLTSVDISEFWYSYFPANALSNLEYLCIRTYLLYPEDQVYQVNQLHRPYDDIPIFRNLTHLELHGGWNLVVQVLQHCPKLQNLTISKEFKGRWNTKDDDQGEWVEPEFVPHCLLSHLRTCTIFQFEDLQSDLMLANYILKNAKYLQTMKVLTWNRDNEKKSELKRKLSPSATCHLEVINLMVGTMSTS